MFITIYEGTGPGTEKEVSPGFFESQLIIMSRPDPMFS